MLPFSVRTRAAMLIALHVAVLVVVWRVLGHGGLSPNLGSDAAGYRSLAVMGGRPYRDFNVAYPPGALGLFHLLGAGNYNAFVRHLIVCNAIAQIAMVILLFRGWGARACWSYGVLSLPLMPMLYFRYDLLVAAFAVLGCYVVKRERPFAGAASWIAGISLKLWPAVLIPGLLAKRQARAFVVAVVTGATALVAWVAWGGAGAPGQVVTYGGARGWEVGSFPASILRLLTHDSVRYEEGALRVGAPPRMLGTLLTLTMVVLIVLVWQHVARHGAPDGLAEMLVVGISMTTATLLSPQFMIWIVPFVAIAAAAGVVRCERWAAAGALLTFALWWNFDERHADARAFELLVLARNVALVVMLVVAARQLVTRRVDAVAPAPALA